MAGLSGLEDQPGHGGLFEAQLRCKRSQKHLPKHEVQAIALEAIEVHLEAI